MSRYTWDESWADAVRAIAKRSNCVRDQVGALIVDPTNRLIASGFNGPPADWQGDLGVTVGNAVGCQVYCWRGTHGPTDETAISYTDCPSIHAEANALLFCDRREREGGTIYVTSHVCWTCAKLVANSGLRRLVLVNADDKTLRVRSPENSYKLLRESGFTVDHA